ncbi:MAG: hypothetical protein HYS77_03070, partial [Candidatus Rokubacteria bacterium]|nr:hypothetical protein [Candidatus Rokubacteria bacterium]
MLPLARAPLALLRLTPEQGVKIVVGCAASLMVLWPVATLIHGSVSLEDPGGGMVYSLENYADILGDR